MILVEPFRFSPIAMQDGVIVVNENLQKFKVCMVSGKGVMLETYNGRLKASLFVYMGELPSTD